jgi:anti-sigma B factor antagonist
MESSRRTEGTFDIIALTGEIDFHHASELRRQIIESLDQGRNVLLDLAAVGFMDSSGIATLVQGLQHAKGRGLRVELAGVKGTVHKVLKLTRMDEVFTLHESVEAGLAVN